ncbi:MAG: hypothetical protein ACRDJW_06175 [Thermomicrobiales bacterium]
MRPSTWVLAVIFALGLVAVAGWVTLAQDDGGNGGDAAGESDVETGDVEAGDDTDRPGVARGIRSEGAFSIAIDLDPLDDLLDFGLEDVTSDVEVRTDVLDAVLRESAMLSDLGDDELLNVERADAELDLDRIDDALSDNERNPIDDLDPVQLDALLADRQLVELGIVATGENDVDVTSDVRLADILDDLDGLRLLDDRNVADTLDRVNLDDLFADAVLQDLAVVELDELFIASNTDGVLANLDLRDMGNLDTLLAPDDRGLLNGLDLLDNLEDLDRLDGVDVLDRLDGRVLPNDLVDLDLNVLEELDTARSDVLDELELLELFDLDDLGLRDGLGLGPP